MLIEGDSSGSSVSDGLHKVTGLRFLTGNTFILRFSRGNIQFKAGQRIIVGLKGDFDQREYSIYSGEQDDYLEILVRIITDGSVSVKLKLVAPGGSLNINGPFGSLGIESFTRYSAKHIFVATGTGISPFHSMIRSYPGLDYTLFHGVRFKNEAYDSTEYESGRYILCTSNEINEGKKGRVTGPLSRFEPSAEMLFYLCGNGDMIYDVFHILRDKGIPAEKIFSEIYF